MYNSTQQKIFFDRSKAIIADTPNVSAEELSAQLRELIVYHEWRYYMLNDPILSDFEYDHLFKLLEKLEQDHPELVVPDSPTQRVSSDVAEDLPAVAHLTPMLSLANSYNAEDLKEFDQQVKRMLNMDENDSISYGVEPKFDGGSIALIYENDQLVRAATRGNGVKGEEMTHNARVMHSIPLRAAFSQYGMHKVELRGEVLIRKDYFEKINQQRAKEGLNLFANARNTATGGLRMKNPKETAQRGLEAFIYTLGYAENKDGENVLSSLDTHYQSLDLLANLGFKVPKDETERKRCKNISEVVDFCINWEKKREGYEYEVDGMVVKVDDRRLQERAGYTSHHPRWAIAYKFAAKQATTKLIQVEYQIGKTGAITPVAKVEPVQLAGVVISSISLHNEDFIREKDLKIGDTVLIERAGDVIPYIVKSMPDLRDGSEIDIDFPTDCPFGHTPLHRQQGEAAWRCANFQCDAQNLQRIIFHVSKPAMNIDGMGKQIVERFVDEGWLKTLADVYRLDYDKIAVLEGFGQKSADNLERSISIAKQNPIHRLLHSLSIHHLGKKVSMLLAGEIKHVLDLKDWTEEKFVNIKDVGPKVAENVMAFFGQDSNIDMLKELESLGVNLTATDADRPKAAVTEGPFVGKTILFTGSLQQMRRKEAQEKAAAAGAKNIRAVRGNLNILVDGDKAGSKLKKAKALETVQILTEEEFLALVND